MAVNERPREKFIQKGVKYLSNSELIAILIGSGTKERSAIVLAHEIMRLANDNLSQLAKLKLNDLVKIKGVGAAKAIVLLSAIEIGKRRRLAEPLDRSIVNSSLDAFNLMQPLMQDLCVEEFWVLYLNNANRVLSKNKISEGGFTSTVVDLRLIMKTALELSATAMILCHNHPSGALKPSNTDLALTDKVRNAGKVMDIQVLDYLIITDNTYYSFADKGRI